MNSQIIKKLPDEPGVYFFRRGKNILYIGKATSLRDRVRSYFSGNIEETRGPLISKMLSEFDNISYQKTDSVLEALILEAHLIKKHQPPANTTDKDDKSFNYVVITKEDFPRVLVVRGKELKENNSPPLAALGPSLKLREGKGRVSLVALAYKFGPFPNGGQLKEALKIVRKMFPFRDKCNPPHPAFGHPPLEQGRENHKSRISRLSSPDQGEGHAKRRVGCFNYQIGLCPGVCTGEISKKDYAKQIKNIVLFFEGNKKKIVKNLKKEMRAFSNSREFEKAAKVKRQMFALNHIQDVSLIKTSQVSKSDFDTKTFRIEAYDVAHLSGTNVVGAMIVVEDGEIKKSDYRKFKIKNESGINDVKALAEILSRRLKHDEWPMPDLIVVDGGVAQKRIAEKIMRENNLKIPVVSVVKDKRHKPKGILGLNQPHFATPFAQGYGGSKKASRDIEDKILLSNAEAHRFAVGFHKQLRGKF
ncbi:MAG: GIY-YIG nuclease family protein [Candidatus Zambryskibacteria bacterium]